jgi:S-adenosylmethionine:tRNA ribosyltransferase-isomerase
MKTADFDFSLPEELIAQHPADHREDARLYFFDRKTKEQKDLLFPDIVSLLSENDVLVCNKSRVIPARIPLRNNSEIFLAEQESENVWRCMVRPGKKFAPRTNIQFSDGSSASVVSVRDDGLRLIRFFPHQKSFVSFLETVGKIPLPPYIKREQSEIDKQRYQTVYSEQSGSVAAPTAGLHFTDVLLDKLKQKGVQIEFVTLHVGLGTFLPVKSDNISDHQMHQEWYEIDPQTAQRLNDAKEHGKKITSVGSTSLRSLESAASQDGKLKTLSGKTDIFLYPPAEFTFVDHFLTNFHLPKSTLFMLLSAFLSPQKTDGILRAKQAYQDAIEKKYRFFSYGDASLWW